EPLEIVDTVCVGPLPDPLDRGQIFVPTGHQELADLLMGYAVLSAVLVERAPALETEHRLQAAPGIIEPGVDHLAVARGGLGADPSLLLEDEPLASVERERTGDREAHHARPHNHALDLRLTHDTSNPKRAASWSIGCPETSRAAHSGNVGAGVVPDARQL